MSDWYIRFQEQEAKNNWFAKVIRRIETLESKVAEMERWGHQPPVCKPHPDAGVNDYSVFSPRPD